MLYYKVMRQIRKRMNLGPGQLRWYLERMAIFNRLPSNATHEDIAIEDISIESIEIDQAHDRFILLILHGGAFAFGSPRTHRPFVTRLCQLTGAKAYVPDYHLPPESRYPSALDDCEAAYNYVRSENPVTPPALFAVHGTPKYATPPPPVENTCPMS